MSLDDVSYPLADRLRNACVYTVIALVFGVLGITFAAHQAELRHRSINFVNSDGRGYYVFLPAVVIDGTFDFSHQIIDHWDEDFDPALLNRRTERGYIKSRYTIGMALTLSPAFLVAHGLAMGVYPLTESHQFTPDGYSPVYQLLIFALILAIGWLTMLLIDHVLVVHFGFSPAAALAGVALFWVGSHYAWYYYREPVMVHVVSTFWVTLAVCASAELLAEADTRMLRRRWLPPMLALAAAMAILCRPTNVFILPVLLLVAWRLHRAGMLGEALLHTPWTLGIIPLILQMWVCYRMTGHAVANGYAQNEGFNWTHPALWQTLFSTRHGLFVWTPVLIVALLGIILRIRGGFRRLESSSQFPMDAGAGNNTNSTMPTIGMPLLLSLAASAILLWYINSAWRDWWFGWAFGNRAFLELALLFCFGLAAVSEYVVNAKPALRRLAVYGCATAVLYNYVLMSLYAARYIQPDGYLF